MSALAQPRIAASPITVELHTASSEALPFENGKFDSVVSTWTLCSIADVRQALREIRRVLKPKGRFFFLEHGLSNEPSVQVWQRRLTPVQKRIADGCHLDRDIRALVEEQFAIAHLEQFYLQPGPKFTGYMYQGVALKRPDPLATAAGAPRE